ncbi:MAG: hypothetical protein ABSF69_09865 [Polyangiaceae bacterium]|jgi:hypothetical protein
MKLIRNTVAAGLAVAAISLAACSSQQGGTGTAGGNNVGATNGPAGPASVGSIGATLTIGNGVHVNSLNWTISNSTNDAAAPYTGTVQITDDAGHEAQSVEFVAGGINAGTYSLSIYGSDSNGDPCAGTSSGIAVTAGAVSSATIVVTCTVPTDASVATILDTGSLYIDAGVVLVDQSPYVCPGIQSFAISPAEVLPPEVAQLTSASTTGVGGTETIVWSTTASGATITNPNSANATFNCGSFTGSASVSLTVGLIGAAPGGVDAGQVCTPAPGNFQQYTATVVCETGGGIACFAPTPNACTTDAGSVCVNFAADVNNCGSCGNVCPATAPSCTSGVCKAPPPVPCTTVGQTNCVSCPNRTNGVCTTTEADFVGLDIASGAVTANGPDYTGAASLTGDCLSCLIAASCLDNPAHGVKGRECEDLGTTGLSTSSATFTNGSGVTGSTVTACENTLACAVGSSGQQCAANAQGDTFCYCGTGGFNGGGPTSCSSRGADVNGACLSQEVAGFTFAQTDANDIVNNYTDTTGANPSGIANQLLNCAAGNNCTSCLQ